jgi:hypothetical protein
VKDARQQDALKEKLAARFESVPGGGSPAEWRTLAA